MWTRLTPEQVAGLFRVAPKMAADAASEFYELALQPRTLPSHDGPWSLLRVQRHADAPEVLTWQIATSSRSNSTGSSSTRSPARTVSCC